MLKRYRGDKLKQAGLAIVLIVALILAGWWLFASSDVEPKRSSEEKAILEAQDERFSVGDPEAPVTIIEYADILCPYCAKAHQEIIPKIQSEYIDKGLVRLEMRMVGMVTPDSQRAAEGAYCVAEQGKFWDYIDTVYDYTWSNYYSKGQEPSDITLFSLSNMPNLTDQLDILDGTQNVHWQECMNKGTYSRSVQDNRSDMRELKGYGTPHFVINGQGYNGSPPFPAFKAVIDAALAKHEANQ